MLAPGLSDTVGHVEEANVDAPGDLDCVTGQSVGISDPDALLRHDQAASMVTPLLGHLAHFSLLRDVRAGAT